MAGTDFSDRSIVIHNEAVFFRKPVRKLPRPAPLVFWILSCLLDLEQPVDSEVACDSLSGLQSFASLPARHHGSLPSTGHSETFALL